MYYYKSKDGIYTARSAPLLLPEETEVSEAEYNDYIKIKYKNLTEE